LSNGVYLLSLRTRFILTCVLLLLALFCVAFSAKSTMQTLQNFRQQNALTRSGDVSTVSQWMTIPYIAHTYHVSEPYLYSRLHLSNPYTLHYVTLQMLATRDHLSTDNLIREIQQAILAYRQQHPVGIASMQNRKEQIARNKQ
jgi:hypothetical protein